jgi:hypothetical protein
MSTFRRCDACSKEAEERRPFQDHGFVLITVEADADADCFDACSWACVAQVALAKAARDATEPTE